MSWNPSVAVLALCLLWLAGPSVASDGKRIKGVKPMAQEEIDLFNQRLGNEDERYDRPARLLKGYVPIYPISRAMSGVEGSCRVAFTIGVNGKALRPEPDADADEKMCAHAIYALNHWEFAPATLQGEPVEFRIRLPFNYALR